MTARRNRRRARLRRSLLVAAVALGPAAMGCDGAETAGDAGAEPAPEVTRILHLVFREEADDRIVIVDGDTDRVLRTLDAGEGGFLRGALRPLQRERARYGVADELPYTLVLQSDGALLLHDEPTGMNLDVAAFGPTSREHFLTLIDGRDPPEHPTLSTPNGSMEDRP